MRGGFTFKGVDIADVYLNYAPELEDTFVYRPSDINVHDETFDGHTGGYFYGVSKQPKEFTLRCYFENHEINRGVMEKIHWLFRKGSSGKLVFQQRPWCYYYATVTEVDDKELYNHYNGIITITMKAYYPFARSDSLYYTPTEKTRIDIDDTTAFLNQSFVLPTTNLVSNGTRLTTQTSFLLYNPGTEPADVGIEIAGEAPEGVIIKNHTTGQECKFIALTDTKTTSSNKYIYYDGINGKCVMKSNNESVINHLYHDYGYISLAPSYPVIRNIYVPAMQSSQTIHTLNFLYDPNKETLEQANLLYAGKYIYLSNTWIKINQITDEHSIWLKSHVVITSAHKTAIVAMNELTVSPVVNMSLSRLNFNYKPTFA